MVKKEDIGFWSHGQDITVPVPYDYGEGFSVEVEKGVIYKSVNSHLVTMEVTTYGIKHYYLNVHMYMSLENGTSSIGGAVSDLNGNRVEYPKSINIEVNRNVTKEEIEKYPDRWEDYDEDDKTDAFDTLEDIDVAIEVVKSWFPGYEFKIEKYV